MTLFGTLPNNKAIDASDVVELTALAANGDTVAGPWSPKVLNMVPPYTCPPNTPVSLSGEILFGGQMTAYVPSLQSQYSTVTLNGNGVAVRTVGGFFFHNLANSHELQHFSCDFVTLQASRANQVFTLGLGLNNGLSGADDYGSGFIVVLES